MHIQSQFAGDDAGDIEQVVDELALALGAALDRRQAMLHFLRFDPSAHEQLRPAEDCIERRAKLVADGREKLVLQPARGLGVFLGEHNLALGLLLSGEIEHHSDGFC